MPGPVDILTAIQNGVVALNNLALQVQGSLRNISGQLAVRRVQLTSSADYYVRADGLDSNGGLANTSTGAFLTLQHGIDQIKTLDMNGKNITLHVSSGSYVGSDMFGAVTGQSNGVFLITGDVTTPSNVVINASVNGNSMGFFNGAQAQLSGLKLVTPGFACLQVADGAVVECVDKMDFGASLYQLEAQHGGELALSGIAYTISGTPTGAHVRSNNLGVIDTAFATVTISTNIAPANFVISELVSVYKANTMTFVGSSLVTGARYLVQGNAVINVNGASSTYFPGTTTGVSTTGGQYV